jgi:hypothetical protein
MIGSCCNVEGRRTWVMWPTVLAYLSMVPEVLRHGGPKSTSGLLKRYFSAKDAGARKAERRRGPRGMRGRANGGAG